MKDNRNVEEKKLDEFIENMEKKNISIPKDFDERVKAKIKGLKPKRHYAAAIVAACACILILFTAGVGLSPKLASYASKVPGLDVIVGWLRGEKGISNAIDHGYIPLDTIVIRENEYNLLLNDIFLDEDRMVFELTLSSDKITDLMHSLENDKPVKIDQDTFTEIPKSLWIKLVFDDFPDSGYVMSSYLKIMSKDTLAYTVEKGFFPGELQEFLDNNPEHISIKVSVHRGSETIYSFEEISLPLDLISFKPSMVVSQNIAFETLYSNHTINDLILSPTRMKLNVSFNNKEGYEFMSFENPRIIDGNGKVYGSEEVRIAFRGNDEITMYFIPSLYFELPESIYFCFDGIRISSIENKSFYLSLNETYPKIIEYMGIKITIENISWVDDKVRIGYSREESNLFKMQGLMFPGYNMHLQSSHSGNGIIKGFSTFEAEKRDGYLVEIEFPGYLIPMEGRIELNIN